MKQIFQQELAEILERNDFQRCYNKVKHLVQLNSKKRKTEKRTSSRVLKQGRVTYAAKDGWLSKLHQGCHSLEPKKFPDFSLTFH